MTKLLEWLTAGVVLVSIWSAVLFGDFITLDAETRLHILLSPIYAIIAFGLISFAIVVHRTATFNDCPEAAAELRRQIEEARKDLISKGFKFDLPQEN